MAALCNEVPRSSNPILNVPTERSLQHPPEGETPPLCWCRDPCKFFKSKQRLSLGMRYWGCANYSCDYPDRRWDTSSYRQPVRTSYSVFPYYFSFKVRTNNLSRLPLGRVLRRTLGWNVRDGVAATGGLFGLGPIAVSCHPGIGLLPDPGRSSPCLIVPLPSSPC